MRLFHVSENPNITEFIPRISERINKKVVWAIDESHVPNFLTPRNCPRVTYHATEASLISDIDKYFSTSKYHVVAIENIYLNAMSNTILYLYEFDTKNFYLQDAIAGYYISEKPAHIINKFCISNPLKDLFDRNIEVRFLDNLWELADKIMQSSLAYSFCRMAFAKKRND